MDKQATILAIDTSTIAMAGAIVRGQQVLASVQTKAERNHSLHIMTNIEKMLHDSKLALHDVSAIVTGIGPGSYTGVRVAVTAAKTLAWATNKTVVGVSSLECLAYSLFVGEKEQTDAAIAIPIVDARRGQVYTAAFAKETAGWNRLAEDHIVLMSDWVEQWAEKLQSTEYANIKQFYIIGEIDKHEAEINRLREMLEQKLGIQFFATDELMKGAAIAAIGAMQMEQGTNAQLLGDAHSLVPNYAQLTEAEVKQNAKEKEQAEDNNQIANEKEVGRK